MKHLWRYKIASVIEGEIEYDPAAPTSLTDALNHVAGIRKQLGDMAATITKDDGKPVKVRD